MPCYKMALIAVAIGFPAVTVATPSVTCPDANVVSVCGSARAASVGNCLICMSTKFGTACTGKEMDNFCSGVVVASCGCQACMGGGKTQDQCESYGLDCSCVTVGCGSKCLSCIHDGSTKAQCASYGLDCSGLHCDLCVGVDCGAHGQCVSSGNCICSDEYTGEHCQTKPLTCCSQGKILCLPPLLISCLLCACALLHVRVWSACRELRPMLRVSGRCVGARVGWGGDGSV